MKWNVLYCIQFIHCALDPILCNNNLAKVFSQRSRHQNRTKKYCKNLNFDQICNGASTFYTASREIPWFSCWKNNNSSSRYSSRHAEHITHENSYFNAFFMRRLEIVKIPFGRVEWREQMELFLVAFASRFFLSSLCCCYGRRFGYKLCKTIVANEKKKSERTEPVASAAESAKATSTEWIASMHWRHGRIQWFSHRSLKCSECARLVCALHEALFLFIFRLFVRNKHSCEYN